MTTEHTPANFIKKAKYDDYGQQIWGTDGDGLQLIAEVRGWGAIQNLFKKGKEFDLESAAEFQREVGKFIADAINEKIEREFGGELKD